MFRNYFKIAWRTISNNKLSAFLNIGGLAAGMAVATLIGLWIHDESSFNKVHKNYIRIGKVIVTETDPVEGTFAMQSLPYPLATTLRSTYSKNFTRLARSSWSQEYILSAGEKKLSREGLFMDEEAPPMFTLKMVHGSWSGLHDIYSIILSQSTAKALFGDADPMNQTVLINNKINVKVTGVYEDLPLNAELTNVKFLSTWDLWVMQNDWILKRAVDDWANHFLRMYGEIKPGSSFEQVNKNISGAELNVIGKMDTYKEDVARQPQIALYPMSQWHLHPLTKGLPGNKPFRMVRLVGLIGLFVLLLACINFMNLSTARSEKRAKEVGIRKTVGSMRTQLVIQFFCESFIIVGAAFILSCVLSSTLLPWFNELSGKSMRLPWDKPLFWLIALIFILITGLLAGSYPALYLSSFRPVKVLKGTFRLGRMAAVPRKGLVVFQFAISLALIIGAIVIFRQIKFARDRGLGYSDKGLIMLQMKSDDFYGKYELLRNEFLKTGVVDNFSESMGKVTEVVSGNNGFDWKGKDPKNDESFVTLAVTADHGKTIGWQFIDGRDFSRDNVGDSSGIVINQTAARFMGLEHPVGETITWKWHDQSPKPYTVIGVIKDVIMDSPYDPVEPSLFFIKALNGGVSWINIRLKQGIATSKALPAIENVFKNIVPSAPFDYKFVDQDYALKFADEERIGKLAAFFSILAVLISCLGLFGLASFMAEQRTKEIGIRKVLGASVTDVWRLLSAQFVFLVIIALIIASPVAYYVMNQWLNNYNYRAELSWWIFAGAGAGAIVLTLITISLQTIRAARQNPVRNLRSE